jgi:hypothetical protein
MYVGQPGCEIGTRYKDNIHYIRNNNPESAYSQHILNQGHAFGPAIETLQLLKHCQKRENFEPLENIFYLKVELKKPV